MQHPKPGKSVCSLHGVEHRIFFICIDGTHVCNESVLHIAAKHHRFKESRIFALNRIHSVAGLSTLESVKYEHPLAGQIKQPLNTGGSEFSGLPIFILILSIVFQTV
jgi:hypothetical protein